MNISDENLLDQCLRDIQSGKATLEGCLDQYPEQREELEPLLNLAMRLQSVEKISAPKEFRNASKARLMRFLAGYNTSKSRRVQTQHRSSRPGVASKNPSWLNIFSSRALIPVIVTLLIVVILAGGVFTVSAQALPGETLYPAKLFAENVRLSISSSSLGAGQVHLAAANNRIYEVETLTALNLDGEIPVALDNYKVHVAALSEFTGQDPQTFQRAEVAFVQEIEQTLGVNEDRLSALSGEVPIDLREIIDEALQVSREARQVVRDVLASLPNYPVLNPTVPGWISETMTAYPMYTYTPPSSTEATPPDYRGTPTVYSNIGQLPTLIATFIGDPSMIFTITPELPRLQTLWPTIYPTLVDIATRLPQITQTPRPNQRPRPIITTPSPPTTRP